MILKDLINRNDWSSVKYHLLRLYPDQEKNIDGYADVYDSLVLATPRKTAMRIVVEEARDFENEPYIDVSGRDGTLQKELEEFKYANQPEDSEFANSEVSWAIEYTPWEEWLGMQIDPEALENFSELEIIAHCLWEMTFAGFDQETIQESIAEIKKREEEIDNMSEEERQERLIPWDEMKKKFFDDSDASEANDQE